MNGFIEGQNRYQSTLFPERIDAHQRRLYTKKSIVFSYGLDQERSLKSSIFYSVFLVTKIDLHQVKKAA
jgi:hypothetical protein